MTKNFTGRLGIIQRVLPSYRVPFIDLLAEHCTEGAGIFAGDPLPKENIHTGVLPEVARYFHANNVHIADPSSPLYTCWQMGIRDWLEEWQPDALVIEANPRYLRSAVAVEWMNRRGRIVLGWGLGAQSSQGFLSDFKDRRRNKFLRQLDGTIAYSHNGAREYQNAGIPEDRIYIAHNAVSRRPELKPPSRPAEFTPRPEILFVGRLQERKRIDLMLQACAQLPEELQPWVTIVGDGPAQAYFREKAEEYYPSAHFTGAVHGENLIPYFQQADLFVLPGTGGLAVQQAMTHGLPVIVAQGDGTQGDLVSEQNGWLIPPGDLQELVDALRDALSDVHRLRQMGQESFRIVREEINLETMVETFVRALNETRKVDG